MHYLVTGITGFAGPHLATLLVKNGHKVTGLLRGSNGMETDILDVVPNAIFEQLNFVYSDLRDGERLAKIFQTDAFDGVFHLAAQSHPPTSFADPVGTFESNVMGTVNLIQAVLDYQPRCRFMMCSTSEVYGKSGEDKHMLGIADAIKPSNPYGVSKAACDIYVQERIKNADLDGFIVRAFSHTGPRRGRNFSISCDAYHLAQMLHGKEPRVLPVGNLASIRAVLDVRDVVRAYALLMETDKSRGGIFNISSTVPHEMGFYTDMLIKLSGIPSVVKKVDKRYWRPIDILYQCGDSTELKTLTGWEPTFKIEDTLQDLFDYWKVKLG